MIPPPAFALLAAVSAPAPPVELAALLPAPPGWTATQPPRRHTADDLFDYLNGAADAFVACDFRELVSQVFDGPGGGSLTVDLFRHADPECAFGMYSQERPERGTYLAIGAEGYWEPGILNFTKGDLYVKLSGFRLGSGERALLERTAAQIAARITGPTRPPALLAALPAGGRIPRSERFLRREVLGYPCLERAFVADYRSGDARLVLHLLATGDAAAARRMRDAYLRTQELPAPAADVLSLRDRHHGPLTLRLAGRFLLLVQGEPGAAGRLAEATAAHLPGR